MNGDIESDVLVIGSGIAGCVTALEAADRGCEVVVLTGSRDPIESNTGHAQGGIIFRGEEDSPDLLVQDILTAGAGVTSPPAAWLLATEGPRLVQELLIDRWQVPFSRNEDGTLNLTREGGHSVARILHADDLTGRAIESTLIAAMQQHPRIALFTGHTAIDLITPSHHSLDPLDVYRDLECIGAYVYDRESNTVKVFRARATVLATGGLGRLYLHTTNPPRSRGDGYAMAARAGARLINMEYVQFHPTTLFRPGADRFLISESLRGEGAELINASGEAFMKRYHPLGALAPRDVVARAIHSQLLERGEECVFLDLSASGMSPDHIRERFPHIYHNCLRFGVDITTQPIPVVPAAHYECGGILVDDWGRTNLARLYAVGEVACTGLHGANRLASTSLLEGLLWGYRAARHLATQGWERSQVHIPPWQEETGRIDPALIAQDESTIRSTMWNYVGLIRSTGRLQRARNDLIQLRQTIENFYRHARLSDSLIGLRNMSEVALLITQAAWHNKTSRGCHFRED